MGQEKHPDKNYRRVSRLTLRNNNIFEHDVQLTSLVVPCWGRLVYRVFPCT